MLIVSPFLSMIFFALALPLLALLPQSPVPEVQRALNDRSTSARRLAAETIAAQGVELEGWLLKEMKKGAPVRQRALLLASALLGTPASFEVLLERVKKGRKPDELRAYALLLYGAFHPDAGRNLDRDKAFARSSFERSCLLAGFLARAGQMPTVDSALFLAKHSSPQELALLSMLAQLQGLPPLASESPSGLSAQVLGSFLSSSAPVSKAHYQTLSGLLPDAWLMGAFREPARAWSKLEKRSFSGELTSRLFALREFQPENQAVAFNALSKKIRQPQPLGWLWGLAGDLGLHLPLPADKTLALPEVGGLLRLALHSRAPAVSLAYQRLGLARALLATERPFETHWPAFLVLALTSDAADDVFFEEAFKRGSYEQNMKLYPVWLFRRPSQMTEEARQAWLRRWSRDLGAGGSGFLDHTAPVWVGNMLLGNTDAMGQILRLTTPIDSLTPETRDHSRQSALYEDIAEFLFSGLYHWDLP